MSLKIGQVAALAGVRVDTVRYYERLGILPLASRRSSGYRVFNAAAVERIKLVKQLQGLGLSLQEIDAMLVGLLRRGSNCREEAPRLESALRRTEAEIAGLERLRSELRQALGRCDSGECDIAARVAAEDGGFRPAAGGGSPTGRLRPRCG